MAGTLRTSLEVPPDLDLDPDPAGSKQSGSGQPDSLPFSSTNHCKHALCSITQMTQCQESVKSLNSKKFMVQHHNKLQSNCLVFYDSMF